MGFSKNDFEKVDLRIKKITEQTVEQIEVDSELPPTIEQLEDNNKTYSIMAAILFFWVTELWASLLTPLMKTGGWWIVQQIKQSMRQEVYRL